MPIFPSDSEDDKYTGPETCSPKCKRYLEAVLEYGLSAEERMILSCRWEGDTWTSIATRVRKSSTATRRMYDAACVKTRRMVQIIRDI